MSKYISIILGLLLLLVVPFFLKDSSGEPIMSLDFVKQQFGKGLEPFQDLSDHVQEESGMGGGSAPAPGVYKYQDENGNWHFGDMKTAGAEEVAIRKQINTVQLPSGSDEEEEEERGSQVTVLRDGSTSNTSDDDDLSLSANPIERMQQGMKMAEQVQDLSKQMDARNQAMEEMLAQ